MWTFSSNQLGSSVVEMFTVGYWFSLIDRLLNSFKLLTLLCCYSYMLWFKFIFGLKFFELVSIFFAIVPDYGNEYRTKEKICTKTKFKPQHNTYGDNWSKAIPMNGKIKNSSQHPLLKNVFAWSSLFIKRHLLYLCILPVSKTLWWNCCSLGNILLLMWPPFFTAVLDGLKCNYCKKFHSEQTLF